MTRLGFIDTETSSLLDIKTAGTIRYAECCSPLSVHWIPPGSERGSRYETHRGPMPRALAEALADPRTIWVAHNAMFDRTVFVEGLQQLALDDIERWVCTAALCRYFGLPGGLGAAGERLKLTQRKNSYGGTAGINLFTKRYAKTYRTPEQEPQEWAKFMRYGDQDTRTLQQLYRALGTAIPHPARMHWHRHERRVFWWDQRVNQLGIPVDRTALASALQMVASVHPLLEEEMSERTGGEIRAVGSPKLRHFLNSEFLMQLPDLRKETLAEALEAGDLHPKAEGLIRLRLHGAKNSLAKYRRMDAMVSNDGRVRAGFLYHGAHTGRWAGQGFQPQNLTRPGEGLDPVEVADAIARCNGDWRQLQAEFDAPIYEILVSGIRGAIQASPGKVFVIGDYNQIESRMLAYGSGCARKLQAFADHDTGRSELDVYEVTALDVLGDATRRQHGKTMDLGLGFGMGDVKFAKVSKQPWLVSRDMVAGWRAAYPEVPAMWYGLQDAFVEAIVRGKSNRFPVTRDRDTKLGVMTLDSGKPLFYHQLRNATWAESIAQGARYGRRAETVERMERAGLDPTNPTHLTRYNRRQVAYLSQHGQVRLVHGGFLVENWDQGSSREVFAEHALRIWDERRLVPVLHSHDEFVFEVPKTEAEAFRDYLTEVMETSPSFAPTLPLKAEVKISPRYTK